MTIERLTITKNAYIFSHLAGKSNYVLVWVRAAMVYSCSSYQQFNFVIPFNFSRLKAVSKRPLKVCIYWTKRKQFLPILSLIGVRGWSKFFRRSKNYIHQTFQLSQFYSEASNFIMTYFPICRECKPPDVQEDWLIMVKKIS
jgi:hypothetical protein